MNKINKHSKKPRLALLKALLLAILGTGCWTTRPIEPPQPCYCGFVKKDQSGEETCAIWLKDWRKPERQPVVDYKSNATCYLQDCEEIFKERETCSVLEAWIPPSPVTPPSDDPCYCDYVRVANHPSGTIACAIWKPGDPFLREYHFTEKCDLTVCAEEPFLESQTYCQKSFQKFYQ